LDEDLECIDQCGVSALSGYVEKIRDEPAELWLLTCTDTDLRVPVRNDSTVDVVLSAEMEDAPPPVINNDLFSHFVETASAKPLEHWLVPSGEMELLNTDDTFCASCSVASSRIHKVLGQPDRYWLVRDENDVDESVG